MVRSSKQELGARRLVMDAFADAVRYHQAGRLELAKSLYEKVLSKSPMHAWAWHCSGMLAAQVGDARGAMSAMRRSAALEPATSLFQSNLGEVIAATDLAAARRSYHRALASDAALGSAYSNLIARSDGAASASKMVRFAKRHAALEPYSAVAQSNLGLLISQFGDFTKAAT